MTSAGPGELVDVSLVGFPLALYREAAEHHDELRREFDMIVRSDDAASQLPARLIELLSELHDRFSGFSDSPNATVTEAIERGDEAVDVAYRVPAHVKQACLDLAQLLDEADRYCLEGDHLLAMATPPAALAFRRWFLGEFVAQSDGGRPTPWPDSTYCAELG